MRRIVKSMEDKYSQESKELVRKVFTESFKRTYRIWYRSRP